MMSKIRKPSGKVVADDKGNRSWAWTGEDNMDTARVRALGEDLSLETPLHVDHKPALDPYNRSGSPPADLPAKPAKRRTLDDMRLLSEHIKKTKIWKRGD